MQQILTHIHEKLSQAQPNPPFINKTS